MTHETILANAKLILRDEVVAGCLTLRDGKVSAIDTGTSVPRGAMDCGGDYLAPGLIELHTDNFERCVSPRPGVRWPIEAAATHHDRDLAAAGITTVCDAIAVGDVSPRSLRITEFESMIGEISNRQANGQFSIDHRLHLRCELGYETVADIVSEYAEHPLLSLISLMDHTPVQRQFSKLPQLVQLEYFRSKYREE